MKREGKRKSIELTKGNKSIDTTISRTEMIQNTTQKNLNEHMSVNNADLTKAAWINLCSPAKHFLSL